jgi:hypothetical protein
MNSERKPTVQTIFLLLSITLILFCLPRETTAATQYGPRADYSLFFYADENIMYTALKAGTIDVMMWELTTVQVADAITDPNLLLMPVPRYDLRAWSLHTNYTTTRIPGWGNIRNPMNQEEFREAVSHCADRAFYTQVICGGFAEPLPVPVNINSRSWWNETTATYVTNELNFDLDKARADLAAGGWIDTDLDGILNFPAGWDGASGQNMLPIRMVKRMDDTKRRDAMVHLITKMASIGINMEIYNVASAAEATPVVMVGKDYHVYASYWTLTRFPTGMYGWFHSSRYLPDAMSTNYHTGYKKDGTPMFPELDAILTQFFYLADLIAAKTACQDAQDYVMRHKIFIPLWCSKSFYAYKNLLATVNMQGCGPEYTNVYLPLKAYRADNPNAPIRVGIKNPPVSLNVITASFPYEASVFSRFMDNFLEMTPGNVVVDVPWAAQDWDISSWVDPDYGTSKTLVKYYLRHGQTWIEPVTGNVLRERNATDHPWTCWYYDATTAAIPYTGYRDIKYLVMPNDYEIDVYFDVESYWNWLNPWGRDMYPEAWRKEPISHLRTDHWVEGVNMTTAPPAPCLLNAVGNRAEGTPIEIVSIDVDGTPLVKDTTPYLATHTGDYVIAGSTAGGPKIKIFKDCTPGQVLTVTYWARGDYTGNTPGGLPWQQVLIGSGAHYISELNNVVGGWCTFKANRNHWLETPLLAELDFAYYFIEGPKPRSGYYEVDILDYLKVLAAQDSTGNGAPGGRYPSANWDPDADVALAAGYVDLWDATTVMGQLKIHEIGVTDLKTFKQFVGQTYRCRINVTVANQGIFAETFDLTLYAEGTPPRSPIGTITVSNLQIGESRTVTFTWNTSLPSLWAKANYTMSAYAEPHPDELNTANNDFTDGWIFVSIPGDTAPAYRLVDIFDVVKITGIYEYHPTDPGYDPNSDIDDNDFIDIFDVVACTAHYDKSW